MTFRTLKKIDIVQNVFWLYVERSNKWPVSVAQYSQPDRGGLSIRAWFNDRIS